MWFFLQKMMQLHPEEPEDALLDQLVVRKLIVNLDLT